MAAPMLRYLSSFRVFKNRNTSLTRSVVRWMSSGDVVVPPSEYDSSINVTIVNHEQDGGIMVEAYSPIGFLLNNGSRVVGPCAIFPRSILHWNVAESADINEESLSLFTMLEPKLDILVIGKGERECVVDEKILMYLRKHKINVEILPTDQACTTFNFLNSERRVCAAALIPPSYVDQYSDDIIEIEAKDEVYRLKADFHENKDIVPDHIVPPGMTQEEIITHGSRLAMGMIRASRKPTLPPDAIAKPRLPAEPSDESKLLEKETVSLPSNTENTSNKDNNNNSDNKRNKP